MHLVGFIIRIYHNARSPKRQICFNLIIGFYSISFMYPNKQTAYIDACIKPQNHKTACKNLPEDEHLDVPNTSKTLKLQH